MSGPRDGLVGTARIAVVVGNPKPLSRTQEAALTLADRLGGADLVVDLADVAGELFDPSSSRVSGNGPCGAAWFSGA